MPFVYPDSVVVRMAMGDYRSVVLADAPAGYWRLGDSEGYAQAVLSNAPFAYWRLGESVGATTALDSSGNGRSAAATGTVTFGQTSNLADGNTAALFDGSTGYLTTAANFGVLAAAAFSFECWFKPASLGAYGEAITTATAKAVLGKTSGNKAWFGQNGGGGTVLAGTTTLVAGTWYHVVGTYDGTSLRLYVNGVLEAGPFAWAAFGGTHGLITIGRDATFGEYFDGTIDEAAVYTYALSAQQIANDYALRTSTIATVTAATAADASGNGRTGTVTGGVTLRQTAQQPDMDKAALFDGASGFVVIPNAAALQITGDLTLECLVKFATLANRVTLLSKNSAKEFELTFEIGGALNFYNGDGATTENAFTTSQPLTSTAVWYHIVVTRNAAAKTIAIYVNGVAQPMSGGGAYTINPASGTNPVNIARSTAAFQFVGGLMDEVAIYSTRLTATQVMAHYVAGAWSDLTADLTDEDLVLDYGIRSSRPEDRVATTGTFTFGLRNDAGNSGGTLGWYSPYNAARRTGFNFRNRVQLGITYGGSTYYWTGRLRVADAVPDSYGERVVHCAAVDWIDEAARANTQVALQTNTTGDVAFAALVACVPIQPQATSVALGSDTYVYAFDNIWQNTKVLSAVADLARSEFGYVYQKRDTTYGETVVYENRHHRVTTSTILATLSQTITELDVANAAADIIDRVRVRVYPRLPSANQVVASLSVSPTSPASVAPGETQTIWIDYTDPVQRSSQIGAKDQIALVATTDYTMNALADGTGTDLTANFTVTVTNFGSSVKFTVTNVGTVPAFLTKLQQRGTALYTLNPIESEAVRGSGDNLAEMDLPYQSDPTLAKLAADYIATLYSAPLANVQAVRFRANQSSALLTAALAGDISDKVQLAEDVTGLTAAQAFYINAVGLRISQTGVVDCTWRLVPADSSAYWVLGQAGASELGSTTLLGF